MPLHRKGQASVERRIPRMKGKVPCLRIPNPVWPSRNRDGLERLSYFVNPLITHGRKTGNHAFPLPQLFAEEPFPSLAAIPFRREDPAYVAGLAGSAVSALIARKFQDEAGRAP